MPTWGDLRQQNPFGGGLEDPGGRLQGDGQEDEQFAARSHPAAQHQRPVPQVSSIALQITAYIFNDDTLVGFYQKLKPFVAPFPTAGLITKVYARSV